MRVYELLLLLLELAGLTVGLWLLYKKLIRGNQAEPLFRGLLLLFVATFLAWVLTKALGLRLWEYAITTTTQLFLFALLVVFHPELRRFLIFVGRAEWLQALGGGAAAVSQDEVGRLVQRVTDAVRYLSKRQIGALMVVEPIANRSELEYQEEFLESGVLLNARLSSELLITLFHPNTPLHDGAVLIRPKGLKVITAGALLPLTEDPNLSWQYGTRHRAAIGLTEGSPCACVVVSEETGNVSFAHHGAIQRVRTLEELRQRLRQFLVQEEAHQPPHTGEEATVTVLEDRDEGKRARA